MAASSIANANVFDHRPATMIFGGRVFACVEKPRGRALEALEVIAKRDAKRFAIGRRLLTRKRQTAERLREPSASERSASRPVRAMR